MSVKWHGCFSVPRQINGGGPQGATLGIIEYLSQSNNCSDFVEPEKRFRFIDDLTLLEILNLLTLNIQEFDVKNSVPSDLPVHNKFVEPGELKTQEFLNKLGDWTKQNKMKLNLMKTKSMLFNFSKTNQFSTRLQLEKTNIEIVNEAKILGTTIADDLRWDKNTENIVKRANKRLQLLTKSASFGADKEELKNIYILFVRSILEQSSVVWNKSLTKDQKTDIERVQKTALKIILNQPDINYRKAMNQVNLESLEERRDQLSLQFAKKCLTNDKVKNMFPERESRCDIKLRNAEKYKVNFAKTTRYQNSAIPQMQKMLNDDETKRRTYQS